jgi:Na+-transporting NADH:ubiquinone oxidoreductase subunit B
MIRGIWDRETVALLLLAAVLPIGVAWLLAGGWGAASRLLFVLLVIAIWQLVWMLARAQPPSLAGVATALAIAVLAPGGLGPLAMLLAISFGIVFGELVFGGWGRNILNPATIALAFLGFGFPAAPWPELPVQLGWAAIPAIVIGVAAGVISARLVAGAAAVFALAVAFDAGVEAIWVASAVTFVLLVCDPVASAVTQGGRWLNGMLYAGLVVLFHLTWGGAAPVQLTISAALLAALAAPLLDEIVIALWHAERKRRLG